MKVLGYYNGNYGPIEEMVVPMNDRACYFGDGVYEAALARNGKIFGLKEHLDRFYNSAGLIKMEVPYTREEITEILLNLLKEMDDNEIFVYWQLTRGTAPRQHQFPDEKVKANLWISMKPGKHADQDHRLKLTDMEDTRFLHCNIKTLNLLPNVMAAQKAEALGCHECVFHRGDIVTECAHSNVHIIKDGVFKSHPTDHYILPGITRMHIIQICKEIGIPVDETPFTFRELMEADEVIVSSTSKLCSVANEMNGQPIGGKAPELVKKIQEAYLEKFDAEVGK